MKITVLRSAVLAAALVVRLAAASPATDDAAYEKTVAARADKIVAALGLTDHAKAARVSAIVARQYHDLRDLQAGRDTQIKAAKVSAADKAALDAAIKAAHAATEAKVAKLHDEFLARLDAELTPAQIDQVKDGMTYGVLPLTFRVYQEMLPQLTEEQKSQIHTWLVEAREHAIDGFTSDEKHAWFGKYKGRINNFLAKAGYDMKQAEKEMLARQKAAPAAK